MNKIEGWIRRVPRCRWSGIAGWRRARTDNVAVPPTARSSSVSPALRLARSAWRLIHTDSARALEVAERAIAAAVATGDIGAEGWGRLARGMHRLYYATPTQAAREIRLATRRLAAVGDRAGQVLAGALLARSMWRQGRYRQALAKVLPLRDEGVRLLRHEQRGVLLNTIAGWYSALGQSEQAFAYLYEALRDARPTRAAASSRKTH